MKNKSLFILFLSVVVLGSAFMAGYYTKDYKKFTADISSPITAISSKQNQNDDLITINSSEVGQKKFEFKFLKDVDECALNKYGNQGWSIVQMGGLSENIINGVHFQANCADRSYSIIEWVIMERDIILQ